MVAGLYQDRGRTLRISVAAVAFAASVLGGGTAFADGFPPFFGYSGYFGQPVVYYTHDHDVQQATTFRDGEAGFGVRTYTTGGPFWGYKTNRIRHSVSARRHLRKGIQVKG